MAEMKGSRGLSATSREEPSIEAGSATIPEIAQAVRAKLEPIVGPLQPDQETRLVEETISLAVQISGPIPPAIVLKGINEVVPGAADRIIRMAELDQKHAHAMDRNQLFYPFVYQTVGLIGGVLVTALAIVLAAYCAVHDHPTIAGVMFGGTLLGVVGVLVKGAWAQDAAEQPQKEPRRRPAKKRRH